MIRISNQIRSNDTLIAALAYARAGWRILPLKPNSKEPLINDWTTKATSDLKIIKMWLKKYPKANIGGVPPADIFVLDIDGPEGMKSYKSLGIKTITAKVISPNGSHRYFKGDIPKSRIGLLKGLDLFCSDGSRYLVLPPSKLKNVRYSWNSQNAIQAPSSDEMAKINGLLTRNKRITVSLPTPVIEGSRNDTLFKIACTLRRRGIAGALVRKALTGLNKSICEEPLSEKEIDTIVESSAKYNQDYEETYADMADVAQKEVDWFWYPYLARGHVTILEGPPGQGKSYVTMHLAAVTSSGGKLPFSDDVVPQGRVLILNAEDDPASVLRPRLTSCGANLLKDRIRFQNKFVPMDKTGIELLETEISSYRPDLVVIDPLLTYMIGDMHRYNEATIFMTDIADLARQYSCCIIGVRHLSKANNDDAGKRGIGSIGFGSRSRSVLQVGKAPDDENQRAIGHVKSNVGPLGATLVYSLQGGGRDDIPKLVWERKADYSADDLNKANEPGRPSKQKPLEHLLRDKLMSGPAKISEIRVMAKDLGLSDSKTSLIRVLEKIAVLEGKGPNARWMLKK